jgi:hypothetical protein
MGAFNEVGELGFKEPVEVCDEFEFFGVGLGW